MTLLSPKYSNVLLSDLTKPQIQLRFIFPYSGNDSASRPPGIPVREFPGIPGNPPPSKFPAGIPGNYWVLGESFWEFIKFPIFTARVCQKVTPFWYPSFLPMLDALYLQFLITYISFLPRDARSASAVLLYRMSSVRPSVCLWRCCI